MFYEYLKSLPSKIASYTGLDIVEPFIESNRARFPEAHFENIDIFRAPLDAYQPDVVFMSQVFNLKYKNADNEEVAKEAMRRFFDIARVGLAIDFMTSYVDYTEADLYYFSPEKMFGFQLIRPPGNLCRAPLFVLPKLQRVLAYVHFARYPCQGLAGPDLLDRSQLKFACKLPSNYRHSCFFLSEIVLYSRSQKWRAVHSELLRQVIGRRARRNSTRVIYEIDPHMRRV